MLTFSTKLGKLITNGHVYTTFPSIIRESAFRHVRALSPLFWRQVASQLSKVRTNDPNASSAVPTASEASGHSSRAWKQRSSAHSLCDYLVLDGPLQGQRANGSRAASRRISLRMWADQHVPRVARTRTELLVQNLSQVALLGPETTSDDGLVGDYARRRPAAAAFGAAATSTTLLQQRGACNSCCTFGTCLRSPSWDLRRRLRRRAGR